jgi:hypothetical protein
MFTWFDPRWNYREQAVGDEGARRFYFGADVVVGVGVECSRRERAESADSRVGLMVRADYF